MIIATIIEHGDGVNVTLHPDFDSALNAADEFVQEYWHEIAVDGEDEDWLLWPRDERISFYFDRQEKEGIMIVPVEGREWPGEWN